MGLRVKEIRGVEAGWFQLQVVGSASLSDTEGLGSYRNDSPTKFVRKVTEKRNKLVEKGFVYGSDRIAL